MTMPQSNFASQSTSLRPTGCPMCGGTERVRRLDYLRCTCCGHEVLETPQQTFITNEVLNAARIRATTMLDRHQVGLARRLMRRPGAVVDVGCGPGRFLWHIQRYGIPAVGVEITSTCVDFATKTLGLDVRTRWPADIIAPALVTFWHSLEHMPLDALTATLQAVSQTAATDTVVLVSVPNADSWLSRVFGKENTYYDNPNHVHQFTPGSLDACMASCGFERCGSHPSWLYSWVGWSLSLLSALGPGHNYYYYTRKRGTDFGFSPAKRHAWNAALTASAPVAAAMGGMLTLLDLAVPRHAAVIQQSYQLSSHAPAADRPRQQSPGGPDHVAP